MHKTKKNEAIKYYECIRWPNGIKCPICSCNKISPFRPHYYRCYDCKYLFCVVTRTYLAQTRAPLYKWKISIEHFAEAESRKINIHEYARLIGVSSATAVNMFFKINNMCKKESIKEYTIGNLERGIFNYKTEETRKILKDEE